MPILSTPDRPTLWVLDGPQPVGRIEWCDTPTRLYGIDARGVVFVFARPAHVDRTPAYRRLFDAIKRPTRLVPGRRHA